MLLGADPGKRGGLAVYNWRTAELCAWRIPTVAVPRSDRSTIDRVDPAGLNALLSFITAVLEPTAAVLEAVHGRGGQSAPAAFQFGAATGILAGQLAAYGIPVHRAPPATWKRRLGVPANKRLAVARASELLPASAGLWPHHTVDDGVAEAALLAYYGAHVLGLDGCEGAPPKRRRTTFTGDILSALR